LRKWGESLELFFFISKKLKKHSVINLKSFSESLDAVGVEIASGSSVGHVRFPVDPDIEEKPQWDGSY